MGDSERRKSTSINMRGITPWLALALAVITFTTPASASEPRVVCYYTNWSVYRPGTARFNPQNINPYLCTHLIYAFGGFTKDNTFKPFDKYQDIEKGGYAKFTGLKTYNKNLKTLLAIGGWNEGSSRFSPMVASRERRKEFVKNAIKFLRQNRFDGLDLDWEYPAFRDGGKPKDRGNYAKLVRELREEFEREAEKTGKPRLLLTMAVPAGIEYIQKGFDVKTLNQYLDWMNLLTYDYHSAFEPAVNHHAPLYPLEEPNEYSVDNELNIDYTIKFYIESGADPDKLVLGIPTYGRSYTLFNADATDIGAPADGPGEQGDATREKGYLAYYEICEALLPKTSGTKKRSVDSDEDEDDDDDEKTESEEADDQPWTVVYPNAKAVGPVAYKGNQWVGYDDIDIVKKKAEYVAEKGLGGIMFWSIDNDDFRGKCHNKPYPLIESAKEAYINKLGSMDNVVVKERPSAGTSAGHRRRNRPRVTTTTTEKTAPAAKSQSNKRKAAASLSTTTPAWSIVTPEPPTTPDPGSDFKCKDEGFFPHPRDCKKYFWCLDSGPSNLGIVAHHFTCPSGLFFNKGADSCDFARNVPCKAGATTAAPATAAPAARATTAAPATTTRRPARLSTKNSFAFRTTTTTTPEPEPEEDFDELLDDAEVDAEDPRVIKELIDLIKKVGGVEQLEKHLHLAENSMADGKATTTPATFKKELYQKVLQRTLATSKISNSLTEGQNSRRGPQNAGLDGTADADKLLSRNRPQYKTISRSRASTPAPVDDDDDVEEPPVPEVSNRARAVEAEKGTTVKPLQYVNIRRARPTSSQDTADDTASRNALFERAEPYVSVSVAEAAGSLDAGGSRRENSLEYVTIRRQRPTTEEATTAQYLNTESEESSYETVLEKELSSAPQPQYKSIVRARSTTTTTPLEEPDSPAPTTVLAVQISSLLNSPINEDTTTADAETPTPETTETDPPTTTKSTTTTTVAPPQRINLRRRGTTTSTTAAPTTTTQVSPRNYTFVRPRRPLPRPNEINSDLEDIGRKIRSTTPDSLEDGVKVSRVSPPRRFRPRGQAINQVKTQTEDSIPAAASPVSRGQFRPSLNRDEVISLTPIDIEQDEAPQFVPRDDNTLRNGRRFRPRTTTVADKVPDSESSAATVEVQRQNFIPRGRSRFVPSTTEANTEQEVTKSNEPSQRRPTFARFTPRPFSRSTFSTTETNVNFDEDETTSAAPRLPSRLPFGRTRSSSQPDVQGRKLTFPLRRQPTTQAPVEEEADDLAAEEDKDDDINLSETAIEEKEHDENFEEPEKLPKRRVVIKNARPIILKEENVVVTTTDTPTMTSDTGRRKFRVVKKRPTSTTAAAEDEPRSDVTVAPPSSVISEAPSSSVHKIRKVIKVRKNKTKPIEEPEPEIIAKSIGSLNSQVKEITESTNYGEKTKPTIISSSTATIQTEQPVTESAEEIPTTLKVKLVEEIKEQEKLAESDDTDKTVEIEKEEEKEIKSGSEQINETNEESENEKQNKNVPKDTEIVLQPEAIIENIQSALDISDQKDSQTEAPKDQNNGEQEDEQIQPETTTKAITQQTSPSVRTRLPYRPPKRVFTSTTPSSPASSRTYSRKYNAGSYTSPATVERASEATRATRKPFFNSNRFRGRPFTTARTTKKAEEDEEYPDEELFDVIDQEPEDQLVVVPPSKLFTRKPSGRTPNNDDGEENEDEDNDQNQNKVTSKKPFKPRVVNSNTFRTSTSTTELPRQGLNRTAIYSRFSGNKTNDTKKRVQNVPVGYSDGKTEVTSEDVKSDQEEKEEEVTTVDSNTEITTDTDEDDYLTVTENTSTTNSEFTSTFDTTNTDKISTATEEIEFDFSTDDYLVFTDDETTVTPTILDGNTNTANNEESTLPNEQTTQSNVVYYSTVTTEPTTTEAATEQARVEPIVKTQFDKLFSVSRVVEVSSKLDKHRINKNNESRLIEEGTIMQEKKPTLDKIGEVSRFSLIKIFENEIPIYLTKLGHSYPVDNPPDNPIRIDEARNARALLNFKEGRENLIASESVNEAYRHINKIPPKKKDQPKPKVEPQSETKKIEHIPSDDFLSFINYDKKPDEPYTLPYYQPDPAQWQFVPAAYENDKIKNNNKPAKTFEVVTPRNMLGTDPSTLPLEGLFKTEVPTEKPNQPFLVYSAASSSEKHSTNIVKLDLIKPESRSIKTYVKGQELDGAAVTEESTVKYPVHVSILPQNADATAKATMETVTTSPLIEMLTTQASTVTMEPTTINTTDMPTVTETMQEETTTQKSLFEAKRPKFAFPRRPVVKSSNITRPNPVASLASLRKGKTVNSNSTVPITGASQNKTASFNPSVKSRFTVNRSQNVPVDLRSKKPSNTVPRAFQKSSTETPKTTTERRLYVKPIRPNLRPAFVPRRIAATKISEN